MSAKELSLSCDASFLHGILSIPMLLGAGQ